MTPLPKILLGAALLALYGCGRDEPAVGESPVPMGGGVAAPIASPPAGPVAAPAASPAPAPPVSYALDLQANHPNGTVLRVTRATLAEDHIALDLAVTNGHRADIRLNDFGKMILTDDTGARYNPAPPPQDPDVRVAEGTSMQGTFVFLGRVSPAATSLTLTTNSGYGGESEHSSAPKIVIRDIPVRRQ